MGRLIVVALNELDRAFLEMEEKIKKKQSPENKG